MSGRLPTCWVGLDTCLLPLLMKLFTVGQRDAIPAAGSSSVDEGPGELPRWLLISLQGWRGRDVLAHASLPTAWGGGEVCWAAESASRGHPCPWSHPIDPGPCLCSWRALKGRRPHPKVAWGSPPGHGPGARY